MKLVIEHIDRHRNGICGAPFHAVFFRDPDEGRMLGVVFDQEYHVAVFQLDKLALGSVAFGVNSWRGDRYELSLRNAIGLRTDGASLPSQSGDLVPHIDVHPLLAGRRAIAVVWGVENVQVVRPDLTNDQAWAVLQAVERAHDSTLGINWDVLTFHAEDLFGDGPDDAEGDEQ